MKNILLLLLNFLWFGMLSGQMNPVQNLTWEHFYDSDNYDNVFQLDWQEPESPHDELIGYNIYRNDELYRFQTEIGLNCAPQFGQYEDCDFIFYIDGGPFTGFVAAVYSEGVESEYVSFEVEGPLLKNTEFQEINSAFYPNPVHQSLNFKDKVYEVSIFNLNGKKLKYVIETNSIDVNNLPKGNYIILYTNSKGKTIKSRFLKK